jgi:hypothetical protein
MAILKQMLDPEVREQVYAVKDALQRERVLDQDPMRLNRTKFDSYLTAKAEALIVEKLAKGLHPDVVFSDTRLSLEVLDRQWRMEAKRLADTHHHAT